ncbi:MAG TPA: hydrogenase iron-sulfur subunit [Desulfobacteraceae bacterium]|nr:hydrogenase iron-sulfur subunit [Desulfobacteraceae bacterium]
MSADKRIRFLKKLLAFAGIEEERLRGRWISSAEATEFVKEINEFIDLLRDLGPSPLRRYRNQDGE